MTKRFRPRRTFAAVGMGLVLVLAGCMSGGQRSALDVLNHDRAAVGRPALVADDELMAKAQAWSERLASAGVLRHSRVDAGVSSCYRLLAENVGRGTSIESVQRALIADVGFDPPMHRLNVRNPAFDHVGTGVTVRNGTTYVVQVFRDAC